MSKWKPIDSAPKDETGVIGYQSLAGGYWVITPMYFSGGSWRIVAFHNDNTEHEMVPTHWMPLPDPPEEKGDV